MRTERFLAQGFLESHPEDAAVILERLTTEELANLLQENRPPIAAAVLERMIPIRAAEVLVLMPLERSREVVDALPIHAAAGILSRMEFGNRETILASLPPDSVKPLRVRLMYPDDTAGYFMDTRILTLTAEMTAGEALGRVRRSLNNVFYYLYITDRNRMLVGVINLRELMIARPGETVGRIMNSPVVHLTVNAHREAILNHPGWGRYPALPVVDHAGVFEGVIRYRTLRELPRRPEAAGWAPVAGAVLLGLSEAMWIGLSAVLVGLAAGMKNRKTGP
jgi:magnesium transporter